MNKYFKSALANVIVVVIIAPFFVSYCHANQNTNWFDSNWQYHRTITIDNSNNPNDLTDYQVKVSLNTHELTSQGKMDPSRSDVRFVDSSSNQVLNHWSYFDWKKTEEVILDVGAPGSWDALGIEKPTIRKIDANTYGMWYHAFNATYQIGFATSTDGVNWTKSPSNPVLSPGNSGEWDDQMVAVGDVMVMPDGTFHMWYDGYGVATNKWQIGLATSTNGINWTRSSSNPILSPSPTGWDSSTSFYANSVIQVAPSTYYMYYDGGDSGDVDDKLQIGLAISNDGIHWTKNAVNPVFAPGSVGTWDAYQVEGSYVYKEGNKYLMYYQGFYQSGVGHRVGIGLAESADGINWTRYQDNPILNKGITGSSDSKLLGHPFVVHIGEEYYMYHLGVTAGSGSKIYLAKMSDTADFWVKVPSVPAHSIKTIDLYYGNPVASSISDGDRTFELFDNFSGTSLNSNKWSSNGTIAVQYGEVVPTGAALSNTYINSKTTFGTNYALDTRTTLPKELDSGSPSTGFRDGSNPLSILSFVSEDNNSGNTVFNKSYESAGQNTVSDSSFSAKTIASTNSALNVFEIKRLSNGSTQFSINGANSNLISSPLITTALPVGISQYDQGSFPTDWMFVRKASDIEPIITVGTETTQLVSLPATGQSFSASSLIQQIWSIVMSFLIPKR